MIIDTHCHLDFKDFDADRGDVLDRAVKAGVRRIINVGSSVEGTKRSLELAERYDMISASVGVHPHEAASVDDGVMNEMKILAREKKVVAIGEVGLDYYRNLSPKDDQIRVFKLFIRLALDRGLPLIIHSREADEDALKILKVEAGNKVSGVVHCFSGNVDFMKQCFDLCLHVSFTCSLTFKKAEALRDVARHVPAERLLLETDAPFLAPQDKRGQRNEPAYLGYLVDQWQDILGLSKEDIERITAHNANRLFSLGLEEPSKIAYPIRQSLYLNITNECSNSCYFCVRQETSFVKGHNLFLDKEPSVEDLMKAVGDAGKFNELVFCGYGEPTARLDIIKEVAARVKKAGAIVRLNTNGQGDMINGRPIVKELKGLVDKVSVSLNAQDAGLYDRICKSRFGPGAYDKVKAFIRECAASGIDTEATCLDLPEVDVKACSRIATGLGARFRPRSLGVVG